MALPSRGTTRFHARSKNTSANLYLHSVERVDSRPMTETLPAWRGSIVGCRHTQCAPASNPQATSRRASDGFTLRLPSSLSTNTTAEIAGSQSGSNSVHPPLAFPSASSSMLYHRKRGSPTGAPPLPLSRSPLPFSAALEEAHGNLCWGAANGRVKWSLIVSGSSFASVCRQRWMQTNQRADATRGRPCRSELDARGRQAYGSRGEKDSKTPIPD